MDFRDLSQSGVQWWPLHQARGGDEDRVKFVCEEGLRIVQTSYGGEKYSLAHRDFLRGILHVVEVDRRALYEHR